MYRAAKHVTSIVYHLGLAVLTGGVSLALTPFLSSHAHLARRVDGLTSGNRLEAELVEKSLDGLDNTIIRSIGMGIGMSLWQAAARPIAYAAICAATVCDGVGYAGRAVYSVSLGLSEDGDNKLKKLWDTSGKRKFVCLNTTRDFLWNIRSIAPSYGSARTIRRNSVLGLSERFLKKADVVGLKL